MIEISFTMGMLVVLLSWILFRAAAFWKNKQVDWKYEAKQIFFLINLAVMARFTFFPFSTVNGQVQPLLFDPAAVYPFKLNLVPIVNLLDYDVSGELLVNLIGNFAMFIPTGIMTPMIYKSRNSLGKVVCTGAAISLAIEILQLPFAVRTSDVDDLILNTAGCLVGYGIYALAKWIRKMVTHFVKR